MRFKGTFIKVLVCCMLVYSAAWAETVDRIVAVVNGEIILYSELRQRISDLEKASPGAKTDDPAARGQIQRDVLHQLIQQRLTDEQVKKTKITVSPGDVDRAIEGIKQQNHFTDAQLEYFVSQEGKTLDQFREKIKKELERSRLLDRVLKSKTVITDAQVDAYLKGEKPTSANERRIAVLVVKPRAQDKGPEDVLKRAREIHARLKEGADFGRMVKEHSDGPAVQEGGDIGYIASEELAPPIEAATRGLGPNEISDVVQTSGGYYIIKVIELRKANASANASDGGVREKVRRQLYQEELNRKFEAWLKELEDKAFIEVFL